MLFKKEKRWFALLVMGVLSLGPSLLRAETAVEPGYNPTPGGGNFGLGLELGDPGGWGIAGKIWIDRRNAFQPVVELGERSTILQLDYVWHDFDLIHLRSTSGEMPFYIGIGGYLRLAGDADIAVRAPVGLSYIFNKKDVPLDIFLQVAPTIWFFSGGYSAFYVYGELGSRFYF